MVVGRRLVAVLVGVVVVAGVLTVPPLAGVAVLAAPAAVDGDVSVPGRGVPVPVAEDAGEDGAVVVSADASAPVWPGAGSTVADVPVAAGRAVVSADAPAAAAVSGVSVLADGGAAAVVRPGSGKFDRSGPGVVADQAPVEVNGLAVGGLSAVRVSGLSRSVAQALGAAQVFTVERTDGVAGSGVVDLRVDYSGYAEAFGGSYADRLRLVALPGCAVTSPELPQCSAVPRPVEAVNNPAVGTLTARVAVSGDQSRLRALMADVGEPLASSQMVYAVTSSASGASTGDYSATDLNPGGTWQVGLSSGSFTYSYPIPEPPLPAGSGLGLSLGYDSQSVDAFTQSTNHQSGWVGLGWSLSPGFIERRFRACSEDVGDGSPVERSDQQYWGNLCWESPDENDGEPDTTDYSNSELYLSLNGVSTRIVKDRVSGEYRTEDDHGWEIELISGGSGKDYWQISTLDGDRYRFGYTDGSNLWVPVVGDDPGEPRYGNYPAAYAQTWRWNLDRVVDVNENQTILNWIEETNYYKRYFSGNILSYDRGAYLDTIEYGYNSTVTGSAPTGKVDFQSMDRCVEATVRDDPVADPYPSGTCPSLSTANASSYPDVPVDLICGSSSCAQYVPSFFTTKRLDQVITYRWRPDVQGYRDIYKIHLRFKTLDPSGLTGKVLWLDRIFPVGLIGANSDAVRLPGVDFGATYLIGRVDYDEVEYGVSKMRLPRVNQVYNGYGGRTKVTYGHVAPCPTGGSGSGNTAYWDWYNAKVGNWDVNTDECAPVWYKPEGAPAGWGQFHKFLAVKVVDADLVGGSPDVVAEYEYRGDAAWALGYGFIDSTGATESWNEWRGYPTVRVHTGSGSDPDGYSMQETTFFRGLYYDYYDDWSTERHTTVTDYDGNAYDDMPGKAGKPLQVRHYQMSGYDPDPGARSFTEVASSRYRYRWTSTGDGPGRRNPHFADRSYTRNRVALDGGGWREDSEKITAFDEFSLPTEIVDWNEVDPSSDNTCTSIAYARRDENDHYLIDYPEAVNTWTGKTCGSGTLLSRSETLYDGRTTIGSQSIFDGNPTEQRAYTSDSGYVTAEASYDNYGRVTSTTDGVGQTTTIAYNPAANWPLDGITTTNPAGHATTTIVSPYHGQPDRVIDANGKQTDIGYDQLGRPVEVYLPADPQSAGIASLTFDYTYTWDGGAGLPTAATRVATHTLRSKTSGGQYLTSYTFDDGLGRVRETQTASPAGGRVIEATYYNPRGLAADASAAFHNTGTPGDGLANPAQTSLPSWTHTDYDTLTRPTAVVAMAGSGELWRTSTEYFGDHTTTTPPQGAAAATVWSDVRGNTTLLQQHQGTGTVDTSYTWDLTNQLTQVTDDAGNTWSYSYDLAGRKIQAADPDAGATSYTYDPASRLTSTTDARGQTISTAYDVLSRPVSRWAGQVDTGTKLAEWVYDTLVAGQPTSSTRWHSGYAYTTSIDGYNDRYQPTGTTISIPTAEGALAGDYTYSYTYTDVGWAQSVTLPAAGGLPAETLTTGYTNLGLLDRYTSDLGGGTTYVDATNYDKTGDLVQQLLGAAGKQLSRDLAWDEATGRLDAITTITGADTTSPATVQDDTYTYDPAGNVLAIVDAVAGPLGQAQCFDYDQLRRLVDAWTTTTAPCADGPSTSVVDGPDPYWHTWSFDTVGNRLTHTDHGLAGAGDTTTSYTYPTPGTAQPHTLTGKTVTDPTGTVVTGYTYDPAGNTTSRPTDVGQQTLTWNPEGHLATVTDETGTTDYLYNTDGNRLITHNGDGSAILYLPEGTEIHATTTGGITCRRYYNDIATRSTTSDLTWLAADHHNTGTLAINADILDVVQRRTDPYGNPRGTTTGGLWPDDKGFLGATADPTGLTHLGAREYDPTIGRFTSVDPVMDLTDPQQWQAYTYANNNPTTWDDPTGLWTPSVNGVPCVDGDCSYYNTDGSFKTADQCAATGCGRGFGSAAGSAARANPAPAVVDSGTAKNGTTWARYADGSAAINGWDIPAGAPDLAQLAPVIDDIMHRHDMGIEETYTAIFWYCESVLNQPGGCTGDLYVELHHRTMQLLIDEGAFIGSMGVAGAGAVTGWSRSLRQTRYLANQPGTAYRRYWCRNSFEPGTQVLMADGTTKAIEDIELGDEVLATDPQTGETEAKAVVATITGEGPKILVEVTIVDEEQATAASVTATDNHPFWVDSKVTWSEADDLQPGDTLLTPDGARVAVIDIVAYRAVAAVHNLTVADLRTYYVIAGTTPVLVHNCSDDFTSHARNRLDQRGVSEGQAREVLQRTPFSYWHDGQWKTGYYDPRSKIFIGKTIDGNINTVMTNIDKGYITRLQRARP